MKGIILLGIILVCVTQGCVTQKACLEKFPIVERHDTTIIYRDTIITVPVFSVDDTTIVWGTVFDTIYASSGTAHSVSYVTHDTLRVMVWQSDTILKVKIDSLNREITIRDSEMLVVQQKCDKSKTERVINKIIALAAVLFGWWLIKRLIELFK